MTVRQGSAV